MTSRTRPDGRARGLLAALLATFAVAGSLVLGVPAGTVGPPAGSAAAAASVRGAVPTGVVTRDRGDLARTGHRRGVREQSARYVGPASGQVVGHGPAPVAAVVATVLALALLGAGPLIRGGTATPAGRIPPARRGRAPPAACVA